MRISFLAFLISLSIESFSQLNNNIKNDILWIGLNNEYKIIDSTMLHPLFISNDVNISRKNKNTYIFSVTNLKLENQRVKIDLYDSISTDTNKILGLNYLVKKIPNPIFLIDSKLIHDTISRTAILKTKKIEIGMDDPEFPSHWLTFKLKSFVIEIDGKQFQSNSNNLTPSMIYYINNTSGNKIRFMNDNVESLNSNGEIRYIYGDKTFILVK